MEEEERRGRNQGGLLCAGSITSSRDSCLKEKGDHSGANNARYSSSRY